MATEAQVIAAARSFAASASAHAEAERARASAEKNLRELTLAKSNAEAVKTNARIALDQLIAEGIDNPIQGANPVQAVEEVKEPPPSLGTHSFKKKKGE